MEVILCFQQLLNLSSFKFAGVLCYRAEKSKNSLIKQKSEKICSGNFHYYHSL